MNDKVRALLTELKNGLLAIYGPRLKGTYLYGSYARGEEDAESDVDIVVVLDRIDGYSAEIDRTSHLISDLALGYGVSVSRVFVSEADWVSRETPFLANAREEAVPA